MYTLIKRKYQDWAKYSPSLVCSLSLFLHCMPCLSASLWQSFVYSLIYSMFNWIFVSKHANEWVWSCLYMGGTQSKQKHLYKKLHCKLHINTVITKEKNETKRYETKTKTLIPCSAFHHCWLIWIIQREFIEVHRSNETEIENEFYCCRLRPQNKTRMNRLDG